MEIKALLNSTLTEIWQYSSTRLLRWRIFALWALLVATWLVATPGYSPIEFAEAAGFLALTMLPLRLWDDLADLDRDRALHPDRVLVTTAHRRAFVFVVVLMLGLLVPPLMFFNDTRRFVIYVALLTMLAFIYHARVAAMLHRAIRVYLVLTKYPVLVFLAGSGLSTRAWLAGLSLYAVLGIYEWRDDSALRDGALSKVFMGSALGVAIVSLVFLTG